MADEPPTASRDARLAARLRENLRRRKAQARDQRRPDDAEAVALQPGSAAAE